MASPRRDPESIYERHIAALPDDAKLRIVALIVDAMARRADGGARLAELHGLGRDAWEGVDPDAWVRDLRDEWQGRP